MSTNGGKDQLLDRFIGVGFNTKDKVLPLSIEFHSSNQITITQGGYKLDSAGEEQPVWTQNEAD